MKHKLPSDFIDDEISVAVAGCGGNGSQVLTGLARMHIALCAVGHPGLDVTAYDPDVITEANVGRQLFSPGDVGQSKAKVLINRINNYFGLQWTARHDYLREVDEFDNGIGRMNNFNLLIGCVDSIRARQSLARCKFADYWLDLGNTDKKGQVILGELENYWKKHHQLPKKKDLKKLKEAGAVMPARLPHVLDIFPELNKKRVKEDDAPSCSLAEALERQDLFINQTVATFALQLLWQFIRQGGLDIHGYFINLETGRVTPLPIK